jgi:NAD(P)-dependent dehydrogenase (short-subunit alcohol dehydrogenase family)
MQGEGIRSDGGNRLPAGAFAKGREQEVRDLKGKLALVTGAARGMGRLHLEALGREGCRLVATDVDEEQLSATVRELSEAGLQVTPYVLDVSDRAACLALAERVQRELAAPDILVNNAGIVEGSSLLDMSEKSARRMVEVNYLGLVWMMQAFVPAMARRGSGHVVNVASTAGKVGVANLGGYCATKFAVIGVTDAARAELAQQGVDFTIINPGYIRTGMFEGSKPSFITRWLEPQAVADAVVRALKRGDAEVCVPVFTVRMAAFARGLCMPRFTDPAFRLLGLHRSFANLRKDNLRPF